MLESGRPVFFCQTRIGRNRRPFSLCKFRSMYVRAPGEEGSLYTGTKDARITRVGAYLRKLRLDEVPQLWNVLKGDMSLIGPRAEWDRLVDRYEKAIRCYHFRHLVKPGITGWAQVNYPYGASEEDALQKLKYDLYYIRRYSLRLDAMIVLKNPAHHALGQGPVNIVGTNPTLAAQPSLPLAAARTVNPAAVAVIAVVVVVADAGFARQPVEDGAHRAVAHAVQQADGTLHGVARRMVGTHHQAQRLDVRGDDQRVADRQYRRAVDHHAVEQAAAASSSSRANDLAGKQFRRVGSLGPARAG